jgi:hypothetical protein
MTNYNLEVLKALRKMNRIPRSPKKLWILFGYKGMFWILAKSIGIRYAWRQARFGGK